MSIVDIVGLGSALRIRKLVKGSVDGRQRSVVRNGVDRRLWSYLRLALQASEHILDPVDQPRVHPCVFQTYLKVVLASAAGEDGLDVRLREQLLEIDVPDPRDIAAVHITIVDEERHRPRPLIGTHDAQILIEAGGILR